MDSQLLYISNSDVVVGILLKRGGIIAYLSKNNSQNILKENKELWVSLEPVTSATDFEPLYGHTVWLAPQSQWWAQQSENEVKSDSCDVWPPDPFITLGEYSVISQTEWSVKIQSPHSVISGVTIEKEIAVNPDGSVYIQVVVVNTSDSEKSWGIWHNTRLDGYMHAYVKAQKDEVTVVPVLSEVSQEMPYDIFDGYFTFTTIQPEKSFVQRASKAFINCRNTSLYGLSKTHVLAIDFEYTPESEIHKEQGLAEVYNITTHNASESLLELETHAPYTTLQVGDAISSWQVWNVYEYKGEHTKQAHISFIDKISNFEL